MSQPDARREGISTLAEIFFGHLANFWRARRARRGHKTSPLRFETLENRLLLSADLIFNAPVNLAADNYTLHFNSGTGDLELLDGATVAASQALADTSGVIINGEANQDDQLTIDFDFGGFFSVSGGITFNGGTGVSDLDKLVVTGGSFTTTTHTFTTTGPEHSGNIVYDDGVGTTSTISYTGLEPVDMTGSTIANLVFNLPGTDDQAILEDDATIGNGVSQIRSQNGAPTFDTTTFSNPTSSLTVNMGGDNGSFMVASLLDFTRSLTINGQAGVDNVTFTGATNLSSAGSDLSITVTGSIVDAAGTSLQVNDLATFNADSITLGENAADTTNFGSLTFNATGAVNLTEDSAMVLTGNNVGSSATLVSSGTMTISTLHTTGSGAVDFLSSGIVTLNGDIITHGGAVTIFNSVILGSPATVTIDTTDSSTVPTGRSIVITGTVNDELVPTSLVLLAGTVGTISLQGAVGGTTPIQGLTVGSANIVRLPAVQTGIGGVSVATAGSTPFIVLGGNINTAQGTPNAGSVLLNGPVRLGTDVTITTDHATGADGSVSFAGAASTINPDPDTPGPRSLTIFAGGGNVSFHGAVGDVQPLEALTVNAGDVSIGANVTSGPQTISATGNVTVAAGGNAVALIANGAQTITAGGTLTVQGGAGTGLSAQILSAGNQTIDASSITLIGGSVGNSSFAQILQTGALGSQTIDVTGPLNLTGGTGGAPDQGNFARIRAAGSQVITAGATTLIGGASGSSNGATITSPNQDITILGDLTIAGGGATSGLVSPAGARIGGINATLTGGVVTAPPGPTNLTLDVSGDVTLTGGSASMASIGSSTLGGTAPATIAMTVGGGLTLNSLGAEARIGAASTNLVAGNITIDAGTIGVGNIVINGGTGIHTLGQIAISTPGNLTLTGGTGTNRPAQILSAGNQTIDASSITLTGGSVGNSSFAQIRQTSPGAGQTIDASSITINGGTSGTDNFARIRNDGTGPLGVQDLDITGALSLTGGTGGAPDQGNFAQIRASGLQTITAGDTTLAGGASGFSNGATITSPNQDITILGDLTLTGGGSVSGLVTGGGARIGGIGATLTGGVVTAPPGPTNLTLDVSGDVTLTGGSASMASIGSSTLGGTAPATITMTVSGNLTLDSLGAEARIGSASTNLVAGNITIDAGASGVGNIVINGGTGIHTLGQIAVSTPGNLTLTGGAGTNRPAQILSAGNQTIDASSVTLTGGSVGNSSFAQILQTGALGSQSIDASSITVNGGASGADNFARIRNDGTGTQTITGSPLITITGGTGGAATLGNIAQIRAAGLQDITAGATTITAGASGFNNFAGIHSPNQIIIVNGDLTLNGGGSSTGAADSVDARIGGLGGAVPTATNLDLTVHGSLAMNGGTATNAGSTIGSNFAGGVATAIKLKVDNDITLGAGTAALSSARIGAPNVGPLTGGDISITAGGNIFLDSNAAAATRSVIRTSLGSLTINANNITVGGSVISATQSINALGDFTVGVPGAANALVSATGPQTITVGDALTVQGGAGTGLTAEIVSSGGQSITASGITILGGSSGTNSFAEIRQTGLGANQAIVVTGGGTLSMQGGLGGLDNFASIRGDGVSQTITVNGGAIALTGGNGPDVAVPPTDTSNNFARIQSSGSQTINAGTIALNGALSGTNSFTSIQGLNQSITTTGDVTLSGGLAAASNSGSRIGGLGGTSPTNLVLDVGGDVVLTAGAVSGATLGSPSAGGGDTNIDITVDGDFVADGTGGGTVRIGSPEGAVAGGNIEIDAGNILFSGRAQLRTLGEVTLTTPGTLSLTGGSTGNGNAALVESSGNQTISAHTIALTGGSVGNSNFAQIRQTGATAGQTIDASSLTINGGTSGTDNFARIRNDGTGAQSIDVAGPLTLTGGTGGAADLGNFAQIRAIGAQDIIAGNTALFAGGAGFSNFAGINSPDQDITIHGTLELTGGSSVAGPTSAGGARIGGLGGAITGPTNLDLKVESSVTMFGGTEVFAGAVIGSDFQGGQTTDITMLVGGSLTMHPGTVLNSGARIGSPSTNPMGGDISIKAGANITMGGSLTVGALGTVIRTIGGKVTLDADGAITIAGSVLSGAQTISAGGNITVSATGVTSATLNATGLQSIDAGGTLSLQGGSAGADRFAMILGAGVQNIDAAAITLWGGSGGTNNFALITASTQDISSAGNVELRGGAGNGNSARIGGLGGGGAPDQPTNLTLEAGGDVLLQGGNVTGTGAQIGPTGTGVPQPTAITITAGQNVFLNAGTAAAARIGSANAGTALGDISITAGASIQLNGTTQAAVIRTLGSVDLDAGTSIFIGGSVLSGAQSVSAGGNITVAAGASGAVLNATGPQSITAGGTLTVQGGAGTGLTAQILGSAGQTIDASSILVAGGSVGNSSFAQIYQTGTLGIQTIDASSLTINGGTSGTDNFARIRNDGTGAQSIDVAGPLTLTGGTGGAADLGNFAQIRAIGAQDIIAGNTALFAGGAGFSNFAGINSPDQDITIHGTLELTGGSSVAGPTSAGGARIGGLGGAITGPTNLDLKVESSVTMFGGTEVFAGAVIGSDFQGGQTTDITMLVGGSLTMHPGTVLNSGARIGSPSTNPMGGDISIKAGANITMGGSLTVGALGTVIRTIGGKVTLDADGAITIAGSVLSGAQTISAGGNITVSATGVTSATLNATGLQTITAGGNLTLQGGAAGTGRSAQILSSGGQMIDASSILVAAGSGGSSNSAGIFATSGSQKITVGTGGLTILGGAGGTNNFAQINGAASGSQTITVNGGNIELESGMGGTNNATFILGSNQVIAATGSVTLTGGGGSGSSSIIGGLNGVETNLELSAGGDVVLAGGSAAGTVAAIGTTGPAPLQPTSIEIHAGGDVILKAGDGTGARIGSSVNSPAAGGDIFIDADGNIELEGTSQATALTAVIRTLGNVTLDSGGTISENPSGLIQANLLTTTSNGDTILTGPNQVTAFNATNTTSGNVTLVDADGLTVTGISNPVGDISVSTTGQMTVTGSLDSGTHDMSLTAPGGVLFTDSAVVNVDLGGTAANEFTNITISNAVTLDGTLDVEIDPLFVPTAGDRFRFMTFASQSGSFDVTNLPASFTLESNPGFLELVFGAANAAPVFVEIADQAVEEGHELSFTVSATDPDDPANELVYSATGLPAGATFDPVTREFSWIPADDAVVTVTFLVTDPDGATDTMDVVLTATNVAPTVDAGANQMVGLQKVKNEHHDHDDDDDDDDGHHHGHDREATVDITAVFNDLGTLDTHTATIDWGDGTPVTAGVVSETPFGPPGSTAGANGTVTGTHTYEAAGEYTVTVTVVDDNGGFHSDTLKVTVKSPTESKHFKARGDEYKLNEDTVLQVNAENGVLDNDRGPAGATLQARLVEGPDHGGLVFNADGSFIYTPDADFNGKDWFWYEFTDGVNVSEAVKVELKIKAVYDAPVSCIDWHAHAGDGWGADYSPFGRSAGSGQSNFSDFG